TEQVRGRADAGRAVTQLAGICSRIVDEGGERCRRHGRMHHQQMRRLPHHGDRREIGRRIVREVAVETLIDRLRAVGADKEGVATRLRARFLRGGGVAGGGGLCPAQPGGGGVVCGWGGGAGGGGGGGARGGGGGRGGGAPGGPALAVWGAGKSRGPRKKRGRK